MLSFLLTLFLLILALMVTSTYAQENSLPENSNKPIRLVSGNYYPEIVVPTTAMTVQSRFNGRYFKLIQFQQIPSNATRQTWEKEGLYLVDYLHDDTYFAVIDQDFDLTTLDQTVITIIDVADLFKVEPALAQLRTRGLSTNKLVVSYYDFLNPQEIFTDLESRSIIIEARRDYSRQLDILVDPAQLDTIISLPYLQFIGAAPGEPILEVYYRNSTGRANYLNSGYNGLTYNGDGVVIAIGEGGVVSITIDYKGRLTELNTGSLSSHKVSVLEHAANGGNLDPTTQYNAWGATLLSTGSTDYAALHDSHNLRFTNHSYGFGVGGGYDSGARNHDLRTAAYPFHIVSYSAGNNGASIGYAPYDGFAGWGNITGAIKQNKTHLAIGALSSNDQVTSFSSRGPAYDGRIFPHVTIEGSGGTSHASPKAVGSMAILSQAYQELNGGTEPPAILLRTVLMNTADDIGNPGPDFLSGYGPPCL